MELYRQSPDKISLKKLAVRLEDQINLSAMKNMFRLSIKKILTGCSLFTFLFLQGNIEASSVANASTRANVGTGNNVEIGGFIISNTASKSVGIRALGPSLGLPGTLANPYLKIYDANGNLLVQNDNWRSTQEAQIIAAGLAPSNDNEAVIIISLGAGLYTAIVNGVAGGTGIGSVEIYDLATSSGQLTNMSTRANVGTGNNVTVLGLIITGTGSRNLVFRGLGPSLPLTGKLANPYLGLYNSSGTLLQSNNNWKDTQKTIIEDAGLAPTNDLESALQRVLNPGLYTVQLTGVSGGTGIGLVELYDITTPPQRLVYQGCCYNSVLAGISEVEIVRTGLITPLASGGTVTIHLNAHAEGTSYPDQPPLAYVSAKLYNQSGAYLGLSTGFAPGLDPLGTNFSGSVTNPNVPFTVRVVASSSHDFPHPDSVFLDYFDVYSP